MDEALNKSESTSKTVTRPLTQEKGRSGIVTSSRFIQDLRKDDLRMPKRLFTYDNMMLDDAVANSVDVTNIMAVSSLSGGKFTSKKGSERSKVAADFLNYCIRNMSYGTWMEAMNDACTDLKNGFAIQNLVVKKSTQGKYKGSYILDKLSPRDAKTIYGWVWNKGNTELRGVVQKPTAVQMREPRLSDFGGNLPFSSIHAGILIDSNYPFISVQQMLHYRHNPTLNNPQGNSPLNSCYDAWIEKKLVEHYEIVGVSKDFGGLIVVRVPAELIEKANDPATYPNEAAEYEALQRDASDLQAGKTTQIVLTSDVDEFSKKYMYDLELKGIQGGGIQYKTEEIINQKRKSIYNNFGTGFLLLGQNGHGSNALAGGMMTTHDYYIQRNVDWKVDVINNQLAPRLLAVNDMYLDYDDMPVFTPSDPSKVDFDTISKVLQRAGSVGLLTDRALEDLYVSAGWDTDGLEEFLREREKKEIKSNAGKSNGSSGTGDTQAGGASSSINSENKSMEDFVVDSETDDEIIAINSTGETIIINKT